MRKSVFGSGQRPGVLKPRNSDATPGSRQSGGYSARKSYMSKLPQYDGGRIKRLSSESLNRLSASSLRYTPTRNNALLPSTLGGSSGSMSSEKRNSSLGTVNRKEMRPITDSAFKSRCIDKVLDFLITNQFEHQIQRRTLLTPSAKDFANIFQFIYRHLDSTYILPNRFEEEIPRLLKMIRYPVQIPKSSFITVGSPHTWPSVLAMLAWFVDVINMKDFDAFAIAFPVDFESEVKLENLRFDAASKVFNCDTEDEMEEQYEAYHQLLEKACNVRPQDMVKLQDELEQLENEEMLLENQQEKIDELKHVYNQIVNDNEKLTMYCQDLQSYISKKKAELEKVQQNLTEETTKVQQVHEKVTQLERLKAEQALSATELAHFKNHANDVAILSQQIQQQCKDLDSKTWEMEMNIGKMRTSLTESVGTYNGLVSELELPSNFEAEIMGGDNSGTWQKSLVQLLRMKKKDTKHNAFEIQTLVRQKENEVYMAKEMVQEKNVAVSKLESKLHRLEEDLTISKNEIDAEKKEMMQENERLLEQIKEERKANKTSLYQKQCAIDQHREDLENMKSHVKERARRGAEFLANVCNAALDHLNFITKECVQFKGAVDELCKDVKKVIEDKGEDKNVSGAV